MMKKQGDHDITCIKCGALFAHITDTYEYVCLYYCRSSFVCTYIARQNSDHFKSYAFGTLGTAKRNMSINFQSIYLPTNILDFIINEDIPRIDPQLILSKATNSQILEIILAFYPHFEFDEAAKEDQELLRKIFIEMVERRLSRVQLPLGLNPAHYFRTTLDYPMFGPQDSTTTVSRGANIIASRISMFNSLCLTYLRNGQYRIAGENLVHFVKIYKHLNKDEISDIENTEDEATETLQDRVLSLQEAHQTIEGIILLLSESETSQGDRQDLQLRLEAATTIVQSRQKMFESAVKDTAFIVELGNYHR